MKKILASLFGLFGFTNANAVEKAPKTIETLQNDTADNFLVPFGYKANWYVFDENELKRKNMNIQDLANQLKLQNQETLSWNDGLSWSFTNYYNRNSCFIMPSLENKIYIVCSINDELNLLDNVIDNYYGFSSYRVADGVAWKIVINNHIERYFSYADGFIFHNYGKQTQAEKQLDLPDISGLDKEQAIDKICEKFEENNRDPLYLTMIDEETPAKLNAILTGQNPLTFDEISIDEVKDKGIAGFLPE